LAVIMVFMVHYATLVAPWLTPGSWPEYLLAACHAAGNAGVDLFFVLSGYLIYGHLIGSRIPFVRYLGRRVRRIYPAFLVVFVVYLLLAWLRPAEGKLPRETLTAAVYVLQNVLLLPGLWPIEPLITVAWSLSYEVFYYLLMPLIVTVLGLRTKSPFFRVRLFGLLAVLLLACFALMGGPVRLLLFIAGVLLFELMRLCRAPGNLSGWGGLALVVVVMLLPMPGPVRQALRVLLLGIGFYLLCFAALAQPHQAIGRVFCCSPLRWLGNMSYSYYLMHGLALKALFMLVAKLLPVGAHGVASLWFIAPAFLFSLLPSALLYLWVERPYSVASSPMRTRTATAAPAG